MEFLAVLLAFIALPLSWCGVVLLISRMGWAGIAAQYRADGPPPEGALLTQQTGFVGKARYKGGLAITVGREGLYLAVHPLFRPFHPPLFVPWQDAFRAEGPGAMLELDVGRPALARLKLPLGVWSAKVALEQGRG